MSFFLTGLRGHISGLSQLPLKERLFLSYAGESCPFSILFSKGHACIFSFFCLHLWAFFVVPCTSMLSSTYTVRQYRKHSTHHSANSPHKAAKQVCADQSATTQASRQSWRGPAGCLSPPHLVVNGAVFLQAEPR